MMLRSQTTTVMLIKTFPVKRGPSEYNLFQTSMKGKGYSKKKIGELWAEEKKDRLEGPVLELNEPTPQITVPKKRQVYGAAKLMSELKGCKGVNICEVAKQLKGVKGLCTKK